MHDSLIRQLMYLRFIYKYVCTMLLLDLSAGTIIYYLVVRKGIKVPRARRLQNLKPGENKQKFTLNDIQINCHNKRNSNKHMESQGLSETKTQTQNRRCQQVVSNILINDCGLLFISTGTS